MNPVTLKAVLFDLDGTLLDTSPDFLIATNLLLERHKKPGISQQQLAPYITNGSAGIIEKVFDISRSHAAFKVLWSELLELYSEHIADKTHYFAGMEKVLTYLQDNHLQWGIVTNKPSKYAFPLLEKLNIKAGCCVCPDHVVHAKPSPEGLLLACNQLNIQPQQAIYIGDHKRDIDAAKSADILSIAACYGFIVDGDDPNLWNANYIIQEPLEIINILQSSQFI